MDAVVLAVAVAAVLAVEAAVVPEAPRVRAAAAATAVAAATDAADPAGTDPAGTEGTKVHDVAAVRAAAADTRVARAPIAGPMGHLVGAALTTASAATAQHAATAQGAALLGIAPTGAAVPPVAAVRAAGIAPGPAAAQAAQAVASGGPDGTVTVIPAVATAVTPAAIQAPPRASSAPPGAIVNSAVRAGDRSGGRRQVRSVAAVAAPPTGHPARTGGTTMTAPQETGATARTASATARTAGTGTAGRAQRLPVENEATGARTGNAVTIVGRPPGGPAIRAGLARTESAVTIAGPARVAIVAISAGPARSDRVARRMVATSIGAAANSVSVRTAASATTGAIGLNGDPSHTARDRGEAEGPAMTSSGDVTRPAGKGQPADAATATKTCPSA